MKMNQSSILLFGHDEASLAARQWTLQSRGYRVLTIQRLSQINSVKRTPEFKLLLLCHSVSPREGAVAKARALVLWPGIQCLRLTEDTGRAPAGFLGHMLHTMDGPNRLIAQVDELVGVRAQPQTLAG